MTETGAGNGPGPAQPPEGERLLQLDRCAVISSPRLPGAGDGPVPLRAPMHYHPASAPARLVASLGVAQLVRASTVDIGDHPAASQPADDHPWVWPAAIRLTDHRLWAEGPQGRSWTWPLDEVVEVVHSATEPCSVVRRIDGPDLALLMPFDEADRFRETLDGALDRRAAAASEDALAALLESTGMRPAAPADPVDPVELPPPADPVALPEPSDGSDRLEPPPLVPLHIEESSLEDGPTTVHRGSAGEPPSPEPVVSVRGVGDRIFRALAWGAGLSVLVIMAMVGLFLLVRATSALRATGFSFLTTSEWQPDSHQFGIAAVLSGTVFIALVALIVSVPLATGTALFISEVAPRRSKQLLVSMVDLMAAVPSIVYGLWGLFFLQGHVIGASRWISTWFAWIPIFKVQGADPTNPLASKSVYTASTFIAGLVVALMVVPISCSIMREVFSQAPAGEREGAYALGATRWGMIRSVVLPFGRGGMIGAVMLGLGRALGETIAVYLIISPVFTVNWHILQSGSNSVASLIVLRQGDASGFGLSALMAAGLALFILTLIVNFTASAMVSRSRSGALTDA